VCAQPSTLSACSESTAYRSLNPQRLHHDAHRARKSRLYECRCPAAPPRRWTRLAPRASQHCLAPPLIICYLSSTGVVRVENARLFESYQRERAKIRSRLDSTRVFSRPRRLHGSRSMRQNA